MWGGALGFASNFIKNPLRAVYTEQRQFFNDPLGGLDSVGKGVTDTAAAATGGQTSEDLEMHDAAERERAAGEAAAEAARVAGEKKEVEDNLSDSERRAGRSRAATILTSPRGLMNDMVSARRTLLGS